MSLVEVCAQTEAVIERARSLFGSGGPAPDAAALGAVDTAAESTTATAQHTGDMSGVAITRYQSFARQSAAQLSQAAHTDTALHAHVASAATHTQTGAQRLEAIAAQTRATAQGASTARTPAAQRTIIAALHSQLTQAADVVNTTKQQASGLASQVRALKYPPPAGGRGDTQALGFGPGGAPQAPPSDDPPHGKDPRYWIDVTKIRYIPEGQLAPYGFMQIGPNLWAPDPHPGYDYTPPPDPVKYPLDVPDIRVIPGDKLFPPGYMQLAPPIGGAPAIGVPNPDGFYQPEAPWTPKQPIDIRDIIQIPPGKLMPWGYIEYVPGWAAPGPELTNTPTIPPDVTPTRRP
jgi:hypothetical protein